LNRFWEFAHTAHHRLEGYLDGREVPQGFFLTSEALENPPFQEADQS